MKSNFICFIILLFFNGIALSQESKSFISRKSGSARASFVENMPTFGLLGIGNVNTETFQNLNSSGKLSGYIRPYKGTNSFLNVNFSFNVNASNDDSLIAGTFLFPDVGTRSFYSTIEYANIVSPGNDNYHFIIPFFEFSNKMIKGRSEDSAKYFSTLNYVFGCRYQFLIKNSDDNASFSIAPFYSIIVVPDEDQEDYRYLFTGDKYSSLKSIIKSYGVKVAFQYNNFQIFADLRHVLGNNMQVPIRDLRGFNSNVGVTFNAAIFEK
ncbi:MAG: hypothetical protein IT249_17720 [Chitinophagaceae bacterium]|nr:hypothetical protein [Chitinophagaceae bacterium]